MVGTGAVMESTAEHRHRLACGALLVPMLPGRPLTLAAAARADAPGMTTFARFARFVNGFGIRLARAAADETNA